MHKRPADNTEHTKKKQHYKMLYIDYFKTTQQRRNYDRKTTI